MKFTVNGQEYETVGPLELCAGRRYWNSYDGVLFHVKNVGGGVVVARKMNGPGAGDVVKFDREEFEIDGFRLHPAKPV